MAVFVICTQYPDNCTGPGVAEYYDNYDPTKYKCGFCEAPVRGATKDEIVEYLKRSYVQPSSLPDAPHSDLVVDKRVMLEELMASGELSPDDEYLKRLANESPSEPETQ